MARTVEAEISSSRTGRKNREARRNGGFWGRAKEAAQTLPQHGNVEIDEQPDRQLRELQIGDDLSLVYREKMLDGLDLEDQLVLHHEVEAVAAIEIDALVSHRDRNLTSCAKSTQGQLLRQAVLVSRLQQAGAEVAVYLDARADDLPRELILSPCLRSSLFHIPVLGNSRPEVARQGRSAPCRRSGRCLCKLLDSAA